MSWTLIAHTFAVGNPGPTTPGIVTTGADLIIVNVVGGGGPSMSDSNGNVWAPLTTQGSGPIGGLFYCEAPIVGAGHTFTSGDSFSVIEVQAWSGSNATPFDVENGNASNPGTSAPCGSVTPSVSGALIIAGAVFNGSNPTNPTTIDSGFTMLDEGHYQAGVNYGGAMAYLVQGAAAAVNPTFAAENASAASTYIAVFKGTGGGGSPPPGGAGPYRFLGEW
jgi:hypothetical protein